MFESPVHAEQLNVLFAEFDESGDGQLDWHEFKKALHRLGVHLQPKATRRLFAFFDHDGEGSISYQEFSTTVFPDLEFE